MKLKNLIPEASSFIMVESLEGELDQAFDIFTSDVEDALQSAETNENLEEAGITGTIGLIMSGPFILKMIGKSMNFLYNKVMAIAGKTPNPDTVGDAIIKFADKAHHKLLIPFEMIAKQFTSDKEKAHRAANIMFIGVIAILLVGTGVEAFDKIKAGSLDGTGSKIVKSIIKGAEIGSSSDFKQMVVKLIKTTAQVFSRG